MSAVAARAARALLEAGLDFSGWPWFRSVSLWLDALLVIEERLDRRRAA
jgi:hypothetical protein